MVGQVVDVVFSLPATIICLLRSGARRAVKHKAAGTSAGFTPTGDPVVAGDSTPKERSGGNQTPKQYRFPETLAP
jgi:hypothetical protein